MDYLSWNNLVWSNDDFYQKSLTEHAWFSNVDWLNFHVKTKIKHGLFSLQHNFLVPNQTIFPQTGTFPSKIKPKICCSCFSLHTWPSAWFSNFIPFPLTFHPKNSSPLLQTRHHEILLLWICPIPDRHQEEFIDAMTESKETLPYLYLIQVQRLENPTSLDV